MELTRQQKKLLFLSPVAWQLSDPSPTLDTEELANPGGPFTFTGDDPDNWSILGESGSDPEIGEVATGEAHADIGTPGGGMVNIFTTAGLISMSQFPVMVLGEFYRAATGVDTATGGTIKYESGVAIFAPLAADFAAAFRSVSTGFVVKRATACDMTISYQNLNHVLTALLGVNTTRTRQTVRAGLTIAANFCAGVWSDGDATAPANYLLAYYDRNDAKVHTALYLAGAFDSELSADAAAYSADAELRIVPVGDDRQVWYNGVLLTTETMTDAAILNGTFAGLFSTDSASVSFTGATATA